MQSYTPSAIINCYSNSLKIDLESTIITLQGIYKPDSQNKFYSGYYYDRLVEQDSKSYIVIKVKPFLRTYLCDNSNKLITLSGYLSRKVTQSASIELSLTVSAICKSESNTVSQEEKEFWELQRKKAQLGRRDISLLVRTELMSMKKPKIALVWAYSSCTKTEFFNALGNANFAIDFDEFNVSFGNVNEILSILKQIDGFYQAITLIRGGGSGLEVFNDNRLLSYLVSMKSPLISAIGHAEEKHHVKLIADLVIDTPTALGKYFSDIVEHVTAEKEKSKAVLVESVKKQFSDRLVVQEKQIEELNRQLAVVSSEKKQSLATFSSQIQTMNKHIAELSQEAEKKDAYIRDRELSHSSELQKINASHAQQINTQNSYIKQLQLRLDQADQKLQSEMNMVTSVYQLQNESLSSQLKDLSMELETKSQALLRLQSNQAHNISYAVLISATLSALLIGVLLATLFS